MIFVLAISQQLVPHGKEKNRPERIYMCTAGASTRLTPTIKLGSECQWGSGGFWNEPCAFSYIAVTVWALVETTQKVADKQMFCLCVCLLQSSKFFHCFSDQKPSQKLLAFRHYLPSDMSATIILVQVVSGLTKNIWQSDTTCLLLWKLL